jgi:hypothetical protein
MNIEKSLLAVSAAVLAAVLLFFGMRSVAAEREFDVDRMIIQRSSIIDRSVPPETYRFSSGENPFREKSDAVEIEVEMDLPPLPDVPLAPPPVFLRSGE